MATLQEDRSLVDQVSRIESLLTELEAIRDPAVRSQTTEIVGGLIALYGEGLSRIVSIVQDLDEPVLSKVRERFVQDDLISHLLLLHDLHPVDVETRVMDALDGVRPYLESHGGNVELLGITGSTVHLRLVGSCHGCPSSTMTLKLAIEEAIRTACPDIEDIDAQGTVPATPDAFFIPLTALTAPGPSDAGQAAPQGWSKVDGIADLGPGNLLPRNVSGQSLIFLNLDGEFYSYDNKCPGCGQSFSGRSSATSTLTCVCGLEFDVRRAGRCLDSPDLHLSPVPLLSQDGVIQVALHG